MGANSVVEGLTPIDEVARQLGVRASTIRYYEERGLVTASSRHAGRRWYGPAEIRRLAIIRFWQNNGLMSLGEIKDVLDGPTAGRPWPDLLQQRLAAIADQSARLERAQAFLEHILDHHDGAAPDGCPYYERLLLQDQSRPGRAPGLGPGNVD